MGLSGDDGGTKRERRWKAAEASGRHGCDCQQGWKCCAGWRNQASTGEGYGCRDTAMARGAAHPAHGVAGQGACICARDRR
mgnify:CR=1 FL=1